VNLVTINLLWLWRIEGAFLVLLYCFDTAINCAAMPKVLADAHASVMVDESGGLLIDAYLAPVVASSIESHALEGGQTFQQFATFLYEVPVEFASDCGMQRSLDGGQSWQSGESAFFFVNSYINTSTGTETIRVRSLAPFSSDNMTLYRMAVNGGRANTIDYYSVAGPVMPLAEGEDVPVMKSWAIVCLFCLFVLSAWRSLM
jgi:hypothetical protein